jgi:amino acid adenylation domain-containing protein
MTTVDRKFSCFLIGRESFVLPCARNLLDYGHQICGMIATDKALTAQPGQLDRWADLHQIPQLQPPANLFDFLSGQPFDYLFSLSNSTILSREILALPRQFAINCHDGPLPKYGGINAPAWALIARERRHGISWHQIAERVDAGDILKQVFFEIEESETAATLNSKCYEAIIGSFPELIAELASGKISPVKQNLLERTYFLSSQKPSPGCILDWQQSARSIAATVRALDFDRQENSIGLPKIALGNQLAIVAAVELSTDRSIAPPGTIVSLGADGLRVSTTSEDLLVRQLQTLDGKPWDLLAFCAGRVGAARALQISPELAHDITELETGLAKHERFWAQRLATLTPLVLPEIERDRGERSTLEFQHIPMAPTLRAFLSDRQPTWQVADFLTVAIATYLSRISQQDCFDLGISFAELDRQLAGIPSLFATEVPCRIEIDRSQSFEMAFEAIARELELIRDRQTYARDVTLRYPELQTEIQIENRLPVSIARVESLAGNRSSRHLNSGLTFVIPDRGDEWCCYYDRALIAPDWCERLLERLAVFIGGIVEQVDRSLTSLPLLPAQEVDLLLNEWNDTQVNFGDKRCIHQLIAAQVARTPDRIAVECADRQLTYRELARRSDRLAAHLVAMGVGADVLVGICLGRSLDTIVGILGILKAGGAYVPLDPAYPPSRLALIIEDAAMPIVLTQSRFVDKLPTYAGKIVCIDELARDPEPQCSHLLPDEVKPHDLAYVIYTSGSTGKPKGVAIEHHSLVNYTLAVRLEYAITAADRVLQLTSLNFDVSAEEIYPCLSVGATLVLRNDATIDSIDNFIQSCHDWEITVTSLPTAFWHELTARLALDNLLVPPSWRLAIIGGEKAAPDKLQAWMALGLKVRLIDAYGPTEGTISALMCDVDSCAPHTPATIAIGRPIANVQAYVLDKNLALCPIGSPGELYLGGAGLARGYLHDPELTARKFIPNPFNPERSARLYRTGDLVRYLSDGKLQFLDRLDEQVKIRGFRIELGEIETLLERHPGVQEAIAINAVGDRHDSIATYIVPKQRHHQMQWWPSVGEYPLYDELLYQSMTTDTPRNQAYQAAIQRTVKNKVVVDIGTGKDAILARFCIEAGAKKVYAIEASETAYYQAIETIARLGLQSKIIPIHGYSTAIDLPEAVDVCLSEIIGTIGSSEGVAPLLNDARRFLKADGCMIPHRCATKIAAITLPAQLRENPSFQELTGHYTRQIFEHVGQPFDVRLCVKNLPHSNIISNSDTFEDLVFDTVTACEYSHQITLTMTKSARLDGLLLWLNLYTAPEIVIDNLEREYSWLPVYFPIFNPGVNVAPGDRIEAACQSWLSDNNINPNYRVIGRLICENGAIFPFRYDSLHHQQSTIPNHFYQLLFPNGQIRIDTESQLSSKSIRTYLSRHLPAYMLPNRIVTIEQLPITPNGKVDRRALLALNTTENSALKATVPRNNLEEILVGIWQEVLEIERIDINDNFFELGGHSLLAIQLFTKIHQRLKVQLPLAILVRSPTVARLAEYLNSSSQANISSSLVPIQPHGTRTPFFCVHSLDPCLLFYKSLVQFLDPEQPFYGIQPYDVDNKLLSFTTIEEIAAYYLWEIRSIQPHGPYYLGGFSFGGFIAFEMAQQLHKQGEKVALLAIFDTPALGIINEISRSAQLDRIWQLFCKYGHRFIYDKVINQFIFYRNRIINTWQKIQGLLRVDRLKLTSAQQQFARTLATNERALESYQPALYPGKITLFKAGYNVNTISLAAGWQDLAQLGVDTIEIPGDHVSLFTPPNAAHLARELDRCLQTSLIEESLDPPELTFDLQLELACEKILYPI